MKKKFIQAVFAESRGIKLYVAHIVQRYDHKFIVAPTTDPNAAQDFINPQNAQEKINLFVNHHNLVYKTEPLEIIDQ